MTNTALRDLDPDVYDGHKNSCWPSDEKRASTPGRDLRRKKQILGTILGVTLVAIVAIIIAGLIVGDTQIDFKEQFKKDWWKGVEFLMLIITAAGPMFLDARNEERRLQKEGDFTNRVLVSLNSVDMQTSKGGDKKYTFYMRTMLESSFGYFFPDDFVQIKVLNGKLKTSKQNPFVKINGSYADWKRIRDHIKNHLSSMEPQGFILRDLGVPTVEEEYTWAVTYEQSGNRDHLNDKFRILLVRTDLLERMGNKSYDDIEPKEQVFDEQQRKYFESRWKILQKLHQIRSQAVAQRYLCETIKFTVPVYEGKRAPAAWDTWPLAEEIVEKSDVSIRLSTEE